MGETLMVSESTSAEEPTAGRTLQDMERVHIGRVFVEANGNVSKAARILAIDRSTLYDKLKRYGLKS
jgi:two-component system response regulator HydG